MSEKNAVSFEKAMERIEEIVSMLENGKSTLDESLSLFEEATNLCAFCNKKLDDAQKKVEQFTMVKISDEDK